MARLGHVWVTEELSERGAIDTEDHLLFIIKFSVIMAELGPCYQSILVKTLLAGRTSIIPACRIRSEGLSDTYGHIYPNVNPRAVTHDWRFALCAS